MMTGAIRTAGPRSLLVGMGQRRLPLGTGQFSVIQFAVAVLILGMLCSMVVGSLKTPVAQARQSALASTLYDLRTQLTFYKLQHCDNPPAGARLAQLLTGSTDAAGNVGSGPQYSAGPYFAAMPENPYNGRTDVKVLQAGVPLMPDGSTGWLYQVNGNRATIVANCRETDTAGRPLVNY